MAYRRNDDIGTGRTQRVTKTEPGVPQPRPLQINDGEIVWNRIAQRTFAAQDDQRRCEAGAVQMADQGQHHPLRAAAGEGWKHEGEPNPIDRGVGHDLCLISTL